MNSAAVLSRAAEPGRFRPAAPVPHNRALGTLGVLIEMGKNTIGAFGAVAYRERYVYSRSWLQDFLLVSDPDGIKHVLLDNSANYRKGKQFQKLIGPALGNGLVNAEDASWRFQRRVAAPMFQARNIAGFAPAMAAATHDMLARWSGLPDGAEIDASEEMTRITYDIISRTMFSNDVRMDYHAMSQALALYLDTIGRVDVAGSILPLWVPTPNRIRGAAPLRFLKAQIGDLVARRRAQLVRDPAGLPDDLLTLLLTTRDPEGGALFGDNEVFDNVMTFIFAGHETTANALAWTLYLLSQFPEWEEKVAGEARAVLEGRMAGTADLPALVSARMVIDESLRLYPPAPLMGREAIGPDTVGGIHIDAGTFVTISPWLIHRHRTLWRDPDYFDPERFAPGRKEAIPRFAYIPFGAGPRICIGMGFAIQEAMIILSGIVQRFHLALMPGHPVEPQARITLRPRYGMRMRLSRRA